MCNEAARLRSLGEIAADFNDLKIPLRFPEGLPNLGEAPSIRITDATAIVRASRDGIVRAAADEGEFAPAAGWRAAEFVMRRWSWPGSNGKPVYNFRSEGRRFDARRDGATAEPGDAVGGRCLIPLDAFFEFTDPGTVADGEGSALSLPLQGQWAPPSPRRGEGADGLALPLDEPQATPPRRAGAARAAKARKAKWRFAAADGGLLGVAGLWRAGVVPGAEGGALRASEAFTMLTCAPGPDIAPYHSRQIVLMPRDRWADWLGIGDRGVVTAGDLIAPTPAGTLVVERVR